MTETKISLDIEGMTCVGCAKSIENALLKVAGVSDASVHFVSSKASVIFDPAKANTSQLTQAVRDAGYDASIPHEDMKAHRHIHNNDVDASFRRFLISAVLTMPFLIQMGAMLFGSSVHMPALVQLILASAVQFGCGWRFYQASLYAVRAGSANMDLLIALGTTAAYVYSVVVYLWGIPQPLYFETSAMIITLILFGRWLEALTKGRASDAVYKLLQLQPKTAYVERDGSFMDIPISDIKKDDIFLVRPGESVPVDGIVIEGKSWVNEAMLTGESFP